MSYPTKPAFVHVGTWDDETRKHPAMKWMEQYTIEFNKRGDWSKEESDWLSKDAVLIKPDGSVHKGNADAFKEAKAVYSAFTSEFHEPYFLICVDTDDGWEMIGTAHMFANCQGTPTAAEKKVKDLQGREWDVKIPGGFHFYYAKQSKAAHDGIVLKKTEILCDSMPAVQILLARGVLKL
ncbi:uncharacterized protein Z520_01028 [Fonsecaea multimorphosa CBS 102226]|uniref:SnoaL-like domain-containing protein n=1 Tax=Fonsecaea multimorphosa CBS 102226 TaxID=1442371 RepID=A0A0D2K910_9EURO|nr:uncharacterized protein Z520_01028 [Fonsecaea multimorphosa CBS 102226]KIY02563.1 hypothetical protein Z520_01028 [Fonsecaea multimorphosa CBS 102226]